MGGIQGEPEFSGLFLAGFLIRILKIPPGPAGSPHGRAPGNHRRKEIRQMPSKSKEARIEQKNLVEAQLNERLKLLADKGMEPQAIAKDNAIRKLRADLRKANERLSVIQAREDKIEEMARAKQEKLSAPKKQKEKKQKAGEEEPEMSKRQKKKLEKQKEKEKKKTDTGEG
jgi:hypothetical protein